MVEVALGSAEAARHQHELDAAKPGGPQRRVDRLLRRSGSRARSEAVGRQSTWAMGCPNRSRRVPVSPGVGLGACSAWARRARTLLDGIGAAQAGELWRRVADAGHDVAEVPEQLGR